MQCDLFYVSVHWVRLFPPCGPSEASVCPIFSDFSFFFYAAAPHHRMQNGHMVVVTFSCAPRISACAVRACAWRHDHGDPLWSFTGISQINRIKEIPPEREDFGEGGCSDWVHLHWGAAYIPPHGLLQLMEMENARAHTHTSCFIITTRLVVMGCNMNDIPLIWS